MWTPQTGTLVILLAPEALGADGHEIARVRLAAAALAPDRTRGLVCVADPADMGFAREAARQFGAATQWLLGPNVAARSDKPFVVARMPEGTTPSQLAEFALALSDVVIAVDKDSETPIVKRARELGKIRGLGDPLRRLPPAPGLAGGLDPARPRSLVGRHFSGRFEKLLLELVAFAGSGGALGGVADSAKEIWKCLRPSWRPKPNFPVKGIDNPGESQCAMLAAVTPIVADYKALDVSAVYGSRLHRDMIWAVHFFAAFAVLAAVAGKLYPKSLALEEGWSYVELVALFAIVFLIARVRRTRLHERWTACRLAAEQLRIACMCLPLFTASPALTTEEPAARDEAPADYTAHAIAEVKRAVRNQGLPKIARPISFAEAADWLGLFVAAQIKYHHDNHRKLESVERRLTQLTRFVFFLSILAAALEIERVREALVLAALWIGLSGGAVAALSAMLVDPKWLLLVTAAGPAFAAALHGAENRLGLVHRAELSKSMAAELGRIEGKLEKAIKASRDDWPLLHTLAFQAAGAMGDENTSWHSLLRRSPDTIP